ncbi:MAG: hypothetical protein PVH77_04770 [Phycisphaerales bacterium]
MLTRKTILGVSTVLTVMLLLASQSLSQQQRPRGQGRGAQDARGQRPQMRRFDPQQMRRMLQQRMQQQLRATDAEWKVLGPHVMKISELNQQLSRAGRGGMFGPFGRRGGRFGAPDTEPTELEKVSEKLTTLLENTGATDEQIKEQLTLLRAAKEKAKKQLVAEQQELKKKVTLRQQAQLMLMGLLD